MTHHPVVLLSLMNYSALPLQFDPTPPKKNYNLVLNNLDIERNISKIQPSIFYKYINKM